MGSCAKTNETNPKLRQGKRNMHRDRGATPIPARQLVFMAGHQNSFQDYPGGGSGNRSEIKGFLSLKKPDTKVPAQMGWLFCVGSKEDPITCWCGVPLPRTLDVKVVSGPSPDMIRASGEAPDATRRPSRQ